MWMASFWREMLDESKSISKLSEKPRAGVNDSDFS